MVQVKFVLLSVNHLLNGYLRSFSLLQKKFFQDIQTVKNEHLEDWKKAFLRQYGLQNLNQSSIYIIDRQLRLMRNKIQNWTKSNYKIYYCPEFRQKDLFSRVALITQRSVLKSFRVPGFNDHRNKMMRRKICRLVRKYLKQYAKYVDQNKGDLGKTDLQTYIGRNFKQARHISKISLQQLEKAKSHFNIESANAKIGAIIQNIQNKMTLQKIRSRFKDIRYVQNIVQTNQEDLANISTFLDGLEQSEDSNEGSESDQSKMEDEEIGGKQGDQNEDMGKGISIQGIQQKQQQKLQTKEQIKKNNNRKYQQSNYTQNRKKNKKIHIQNMDDLELHNITNKL